MNIKLKYLSLIILPVLLFISARTLKTAQCPYYLNFYDPSYNYLISSLNLAKGFPVGHFDHPGTPVQVIGAVVIRIYYWTGDKNLDFMTDVLTRPEDYLDPINTVLILITSMVLFLLGLFTFKVSGNFLLSLLIQLSPFVSSEILYGLKIVASDNFLVTASLCFTGALIYYRYKIRADENPPFKFILVFAGVCGLALATKISFFPMLLIPLIIIKGIKKKIIFTLCVIASFVIFVLPAISNYSEFIKWLWRLFLYSGNYGHGSPTVVDLNDFTQNLKSIFQKDIFFAATYFLSVATLILKLITNKNEPNKKVTSDKDYKLLLSIFLSITFQIIVVAKQYRQHYMIPSFILCMLSLYLCVSLLSEYLKKINLKYAYMIIIVVVSSASIYQILESYESCIWLRDEALSIERYVTEIGKDEIVIPSFGSANKEIAIAAGILSAGQKVKTYKFFLSKMKSRQFFFIPWLPELYSFKSKEEVNETLQNRKKIIFQTNQNDLEAFLRMLKNIYNLKNISSSLLFKNKNNEFVYEVRYEN